MKLPSTLLLSLFVGATLASPLWAQSTPAPAPAPAAAEETTELGDHMSKMSSAFKKLRSQIADAEKNDSSLELVATIRKNALAALELVPEKTADVPAADQAKFKTDYVVRMKSLLVDIEKLETALKAGNNEEAKAQIEVLGNAQKEGHKEFRKKKPEKK